MPPISSSARPGLRLGDFTTDRRVVLLMGLAIPVGLASVAAAWILLRLIALCTNLAYHGLFSFADLPITTGRLGVGSVAIPVIGCLIIGLMAIARITVRPVARVSFAIAKHADPRSPPAR